MLREESDDNIISEDFDYNKLHNMFLTNKFEKKLFNCSFKKVDNFGKISSIEHISLNETFNLLNRFNHKNG